MKIPNRFVFVWIGREFPFHARLAVESALLADRHATVEVNVCGPGAQDEHLRAIEHRDRVSLHPLDPEACLAGLSGFDIDPRGLLDVWRQIPARAASARSNLLRYALLHQRGGIYLDTDVLVLRSFADLLDGLPFIGAEVVWVVDEDRVRGRLRPWMIRPTVAWALSYAGRRLDSRCCASRLRMDARAAVLDRHWAVVAANNAVIGARAGDAFLGRLLREVPTIDPTVRYALGPSLVTRLARGAPDVRVLEPEHLYAVPPSLSFRFFEDRGLSLPPASRLIHYVGSNHRQLLARLSPEEVRRRRADAVFYAVADRVLQAAG